MGEKPPYLASPDEVDMEAEERAIRISGAIATLLFALAVASGYRWLPRFFEFPTELVDRLAFAAVAAALVIVWVLLAMMVVSTGRRLSPEDIGGSAAGPPSEKIAIYVAFLQNTLEQAVIAVGAYLAVAALVSGPWLSAIVVAVLFFALGRIFFLAGYRKGASGRAFGMFMTTLPSLAGYVSVIVLLVMRIF